MFADFGVIVVDGFPPQHFLADAIWLEICPQGFATLIMTDNGITGDRKGQYDGGPIGVCGCRVDWLRE